MIEVAHHGAAHALQNAATAPLAHDAAVHPPVVGPLRPVRQLLQRLARRSTTTTSASTSNDAAAPVQQLLRRVGGPRNRTAAVVRRAPERCTTSHACEVQATSQPGEDGLLLLQDGGAIIEQRKLTGPHGADGRRAVLRLQSSGELLQGSCAAQAQLLSQQSVEALGAPQRRRLRPGRALARTLWRHVLRPLGRRAAAIAAHLRPQGVGHNDGTLAERALNVTSCAPFFAVGLSVLRQATGNPARRFGRLFLLVSGVATAYHACPGKGWPRLVLRMLDHWTIALSAGALRAATRRRPAAPTARPGGGALPGALAAVLRVGSVAAVPFCPSLVSSVNFLLVEVQCLSLALRAPTPRALRHWACHATASALAGGAYVLEDQLADEAAGRVAPGMHAAWHVLGALAVLTVQPFVLVVDAGVEAASASGGLVRLPLAA